ncbi:golgin subfamily A member 5 isoform X2 [Helicoverpa zea]|uniref:golgin subfamily A member 5 isoform X2 n=1 Tax=Helicoverpa zea TaxID=7113 RepID=UPI001F5728BC|nr:golgin subfamily A member 5 isoform X2 [Helicoverpa zea]
MAWFADLAGKAESLLNNLDEQTGAALRNHNVTKKRFDGSGTEFGVSHATETIWTPRKRPVSRTIKKAAPIPDTAKSVYSPSRKSSPTSHHHHQSRAPAKEYQDSSRNGSVKSKKSPSRKASPHKQYNLDHCPKTLVGDVKDNEIFDHFGLKQRTDLEILNGEEWTYKMQNMEVENAMLKNELNVMNREVAELLDRLRKTEDGNDVDSSEVTKSRIKQETTEVLNHRLNLEKQSLSSQVELLSVKIQEHTNAEVSKFKDYNQRLESENIVLKNKNAELEEKFKALQDATKERDALQTKLENDYRHAQSTITELQESLQKTSEECRRLEKDWEAYKLRVKNMLQAKDKEIKKLQEGLNVNDDTKVLMEQMTHLKEERDELQDAVAHVRSECADMKLYLQQVETRNNAAERVVTALRDALRDERAARNRAEGQCVSVAKEMKTLQMETGQTIASLRTALRDKENELNHIRDTASTVRTADTSALNVADYDVMQDNIDSEKVNYLTQTLVQRQAKIDTLLAENNVLRIQLDKLETKLKSEASRGNRSSNSNSNSHSVVHVQDGDSRRNRPHAANTLSALVLRLGVMVKRYPVVRLFVICYVIFLHVWVLTVLFTSTPEDYIPPSKS